MMIEDLERSLNIRHVPEALWQRVRSNAKASGMTVAGYCRRVLAEASVYEFPSPSEVPGPAEEQTTE